MLKKTKTPIYKAFGLTIYSEIPLIELVPVYEIISDDVDITIKHEELKNLNINLPEKNFSFLFKEKEVIYKFLDVAVFTIKEGKRILVYPLKDYREDVTRSVILGTCMGVALLQRKILPLHGSAFFINGTAYAIIGDSGVGKSTLASVFLNKGFELLTDDVIAVTFSQTNVPIVSPSYPQQKLWENSLKEFNMDCSRYTSLYKRERKFAIPVESNFLEFPAPLAGIFELKKCEENQLRIEKINGLERLKTLYENTYRNLLIPQLDLFYWHLEVSTRLVQFVDIDRISRPTDRFTAFEIADLILNEIEGGKKDVYKSSIAE
jgi:hypothetical protein